MARNLKFPFFSALTEDDRQHILDLAEKYVMICCYKYLFCPASTTDEEKDLEMQNRIRDGIHQFYYIPDKESCLLFTSAAITNSSPCLPTDLAE
jgi:hypothetical protein